MDSATDVVVFLLLTVNIFSCFFSMAVAYRGRQAPPAGMVTLEPTASLAHLASLAVMGLKVRKESVLMKSSRNLGGPTISSVPGTL